jgi:hypothetical protein
VEFNSVNCDLILAAFVISKTRMASHRTSGQKASILGAGFDISQSKIKSSLLRRIAYTNSICRDMKRTFMIHPGLEYMWVPSGCPVHPTCLTFIIHMTDWLASFRISFLRFWQSQHPYYKRRWWWQRKRCVPWRHNTQTGVLHASRVHMMTMATNCLIRCDLSYNKWIYGKYRVFQWPSVWTSKLLTVSNDKHTAEQWTRAWIRCNFIWVSKGMHIAESISPLELASFLILIIPQETVRLFEWRDKNRVRVDVGKTFWQWQGTHVNASVDHL